MLALTAILTLYAFMRRCKRKLSAGGVAALTVAAVAAAIAALLWAPEDREAPTRVLWSMARLQ